MELFLFRHSLYEQRYNCSLIQIDSIPVEQRIFPIQSTVNIILGTVYYLLYVPCLHSIWQNLDSSCYKILFFIGITDLAILWFFIWIGYASLTGAVFCSNPTLGYWIGLFVTGIWICESSADILLAFSRCVEIFWPKVGRHLFDGKRTWLWCLLCIAYALYWFLFVNPGVYSSAPFGNFNFNPYAGYIDMPFNAYTPKLYVIHNFTLGIGLPLLYLLFLVGFTCKFKSFQSNANVARKEFMIFLQVFAISMLNSMTTLLYVPLQYMYISPELATILLTIGQYSWLHIHGFPPVIYLLLNQTIRQDSKRLIATVCRHLFRKTATKQTQITVVVQLSRRNAATGTY